LRQNNESGDIRTEGEVSYRVRLLQREFPSRESLSSRRDYIPVQYLRGEDLGRGGPTTEHRITSVANVACAVRASRFWGASRHPKLKIIKRLPTQHIEPELSECPHIDEHGIWTSQQVRHFRNH